MIADDLSDKKQKLEMTKEERMVRFVTKTVAVVLLLMVVAMTSCTMHSNTYDADRLAEEAKIQEAENVREQLIQQTKQVRIKAIESLIREGNNPIAVRCALDNGLSRSDKEQCNILGIALSGKIPSGYDNR